MPSNRHRCPLNHATPTQIYIRVAYQLVRLDHRKNKKAYGAFPAAGIQRLAERLAPLGFSAIPAYLRAAARHVAGGQSMQTWRTLEPWDWKRSVFKQRWR